MRHARNQGFAGVGMITAVLVAFWALPQAEAAPDAVPTVGEECEITFQPESVRAGEQAEVSANLSESVGEIERAEVEDDSGLRIQHEAGGTPLVLHLEVDASEAEAGTWTVTVHGDEGQCEGELEVTYGSR